MQQYLDLLTDVLENGESRTDRTGLGLVERKVVQLRSHDSAEARQWHRVLVAFTPQGRIDASAEMARQVLVRYSYGAVSHTVSVQYSLCAVGWFVGDGEKR